MQDTITAPPSEQAINIATHDLCEVKLILASIISAINAGPKSRARSIVITKLEEASMWANEGLRLE